MPTSIAWKLSSPSSVFNPWKLCEIIQCLHPIDLHHEEGAEVVHWPLSCGTIISEEGCPPEYN
jgi:hypothetical protein